MILSASRRTDIPAFFTFWFYRRIEEGFVYVRNPVNKNQVSHIEISPLTVESIVFWTKNPHKDFIDNLRILDEKGYKYYFQFTVTPYGDDIERNLPAKEKIIDTFKSLSEKIGREKIIWRYDPVLITGRYSVDSHKKYFDYYAEKIGAYANKCIISFIDNYKKIDKRLLENNIKLLTDKQILEIAADIKKTACKHSLKIETCCEEIDLSAFNIEHGHCIDGNLINSITGKQYSFKKDKSQRLHCGCISSIDIGAYNTCRHGCLYCYANGSNIYEDTSPLELSPALCSEITDKDKITSRLVSKSALPENELFTC